MSATPRTDEAWEHVDGGNCWINLLICSRDLEAENATLREEIKDRNDTFKRIVENDTAKDEKHCGCCVMLRARVKELETAAEGDRTLIESGEFVRDAQAKRIAELTEWRPMEDAPKDGMFLGWDAFYSEFHLCQTTNTGKVYSIAGGDDVCFTGWLPLPPKKGKDT